ncbi:uncharacterized protein LOC143038649 [Oratosquilla oratoria]|uniref:uncharacterized protein LOC143038649 n=1 Tax=Oratosquilla oratoria TaxID=337810 RepID=UPI003F760E98
MPSGPSPSTTCQRPQCATLCRCVSHGDRPSASRHVGDIKSSAAAALSADNAVDVSHVTPPPTGHFCVTALRHLSVPVPYCLTTQVRNHRDRHSAPRHVGDIWNQPTDAALGADDVVDISHLAPRNERFRITSTSETGTATPPYGFTGRSERPSSPSA